MFTFYIEHQNPSIAIRPENIEVELGVGSASAQVWWREPTASDNSGSVKLSSSHKPGDHFPVGVTTVTYTAEDLSLYKTIYTFTVNVTGKIC